MIAVGSDTRGGRGYPGSVPAEPPGDPRLLLLTRSGCHLCDAARSVVADVATRTGTAWREVDVDQDPALRRAWSEQVPVVLVDGARHAYWTVDGARLESALGSGGGWRSRWRR